MSGEFRTYFCEKCKKSVQLDKYPVVCPDCKKTILKKDYLGLVGEYLIASKLISLNIYAQVTAGNMKKMDLLVSFAKEGKTHVFKRIEVKTKQTGKFPMVGGIPLIDDNSIIIFVDFYKKSFDQNPDFYILNSRDYEQYFRKKIVAWVEMKKAQKQDRNSFRTNWIRNHPNLTVELREDENKISTYLIDDSEEKDFNLNYLDKATGSIHWQKKDGEYAKLGINVFPHEIKQYQDQWGKIME